MGILHLTRGEAGTRGSGEEREAEARAAADALGVTVVGFLDCGDGSLRRGEAEEDALIEKLRLYRPDLVLSPAPADRHPDHGRAHRLVEDACFYAGLRRRAAGRGGEPHRPAVNFAYMQNDAFPPAFIVDVTDILGHEGGLAGRLLEPALRARQRGPRRAVDQVGSREFGLGVEAAPATSAC